MLGRATMWELHVLPLAGTLELKTFGSSEFREALSW
jgi:hypothetical protein